MPEYNQPTDLAAIVGELQRKVERLEMSQRTALTSAQSELLSAAALQSAYANVGVVQEARALRPASYVSATPVSSGIALVGGATVPFPSVTVTGSLFQVFWTWTWGDWAPSMPSSAYYAEELTAIFWMDGTPPPGTWTRFGAGTPPPSVYVPEVIVGVVEAAPGSHTFKGAWSATSTGAGAPSIHASIFDQSLVVVPLRLD